MNRASKSRTEALVNRVYGAIGDPARWPDALIAVADCLGGIGGQFVYNAPPGGKHMLVLGRLDEQYTAVFHEHHVWNQWTLAVKDEPFDQPIILGSLIDRRSIDRRWRRLQHARELTAR